jgi:lipopolysaccharide transport system permease protein
MSTGSQIMPASLSTLPRHAGHPWQLFSSLWRNRWLILQLTKRDVLSRYRGSVIGLAWSFFNPLLMLAIYTFVFSTVFKSRWTSSAEETKVDFAIVLFVGLIVHGLFAECLNRAPGIILSNANYVKKVVFPLEILPCVVMGSALFHAAVSLLVLLVAQLIFDHALPLTLVFFPIVFVPLLLGTIGFAWIVASLGVYLRDIGQTIAIVTTVMQFLSPVFYPASAFPESYRFLLLLNPLTFIIEQARGVLLWNQPPNWFGFLLYTCASAAIAWVGFWWFQRTRRGFADVV